MENQLSGNNTMCSETKLPGKWCIVQKEDFRFGEQYLHREDLDLESCASRCCSTDGCISFDWAPTTYTNLTPYKQCYLYSNLTENSIENSTVIAHGDHDCGDFSHYFLVSVENKESTIFVVILIVPLSLFLLYFLRQCFIRYRKRQRKLPAFGLINEVWQRSNKGSNFELLSDMVEEFSGDRCPVGTSVRMESIVPPFENTPIHHAFRSSKKVKGDHLQLQNYDDRILGVSVPITNGSWQSRLRGSTPSTMFDSPGTVGELLGNEAGGCCRNTSDLSNHLDTSLIAKSGPPHSHESFMFDLNVEEPNKAIATSASPPFSFSKEVPFQLKDHVKPKVRSISHQPSQACIPLSLVSVVDLETPDEKREYPDTDEVKSNCSMSSNNVRFGSPTRFGRVTGESSASVLTLSVGNVTKLSPAGATWRLQRRSGGKTGLAGVHHIPHDQIKKGSRIGRGITGDVFRGKYCYMDVAIKVCRKKWQDMTSIEQNAFIREIELTIASSGHQNVVRIYGYCTEPNWIVMEYCKFSVFDLMPQLYAFQRLEVLIGLARGLTFIHRHNIVHRDIAARNLLLGAEGQTKIIDFGRSRRLSLDDYDTKSSETSAIKFGPVKWMSPEQIVLNKYSKKSDVWAFGITAWEIWTGDEPFPKMKPLDAAKIIAKGKHPNISYLPSGMKQILEHTWTMDAELRPTMEEILQKLTTLRNDPSIYQYGR